ncbi:MAG: hypothetical protein WBP85_13075 [Terracidiphilus sp.]
MNFANDNGWQIFVGVTTVAVIASVAAYLVQRRRPTPEEIEHERREFLVQSGRLVDGMLLDVYDVEDDAGQKRTFLLFNYRIAGVNYECSQEITAMRAIVEAGEVRAGFPCSVRYQPGNPHNSIVIAEGWTGLRAGLPQFPAIDDPDPIDRSHLSPGAQ